MGEGKLRMKEHFFPEGELSEALARANRLLATKLRKGYEINYPILKLNSATGMIKLSPSKMLKHDLRGNGPSFCRSVKTCPRRAYYG